MKDNNSNSPAHRDRPKGEGIDEGNTGNPKERQKDLREGMDGPITEGEIRAQAIEKIKIAVSDPHPYTLEVIQEMLHEVRYRVTCIRKEEAGSTIS